MGGFATGFFGAIGNQAQSQIQQWQQRDNEARQFQFQQQMEILKLNEVPQWWIDSFTQQKGRPPTEQDKAQGLEDMHKQAVDSIMGKDIYGHSKPIKDIVQKLGKTLGIGHAFNKAKAQQSQQGQGQPMSEQTPIGGSSTVPPTGGGMGITKLPGAGTGINQPSQPSAEPWVHPTPGQDNQKGGGGPLSSIMGGGGSSGSGPTGPPPFSGGGDPGGANEFEFE